MFSANVLVAKRANSPKNGPVPVPARERLQAFEVTPAKKLVWSIPGTASKGNMGNLQILDVPGDVYQFGVLK